MKRLLTILSILFMGIITSCTKDEFIDSNSNYGTIDAQQPYKSVLVASGLRATDLRPGMQSVFDSVVNKTFGTYITSNGSIYAYEVDHSNNNTVTTVLVSSYIPNNTGVNGTQFDSHDYPTITTCDDYINIFYADQANVNNPGTRQAYCTVKHSIQAGAWVDRHTGLRSEYPMPMTYNCDDNPCTKDTIFLFNRQILRNGIDVPKQDPDIRGTYRFMRVTIFVNGGATQLETNVVMSTFDCIAYNCTVSSLDDRYNCTSILPTTDPLSRDGIGSQQLDEFYLTHIYKLQPQQGQPERWGITWMMAGGYNSSGLIQHDIKHKDLYYVMYQPSNRHFYTIDERDLGTQINATNLSYCLAWNSGVPNRSNPSYINIGASTYNNASINATHKWNGSSWQTITPSGLSSNTRYIEYKDNIWYAYSPTIIQSSTNGISWTNYNTITISYLSGGTVYIVPTLNLNGYSNSRPISKMIAIKLKSGNTSPDWIG